MIFNQKRFNDWLAEYLKLQVDEEVIQTLRSMYEMGVPPAAVIKMGEAEMKRNKK